MRVLMLQRRHARKDGPRPVPADSATCRCMEILGIAIGAGTNVAIESADLVLVDNDPEDVSRALRLSGITYRKMIQHLFWATGYNVIALPLAAGVAFPLGPLLSLAVGAHLMSASTVIVAINAMLMHRRDLREG